LLSAYLEKSVEAFMRQQEAAPNRTGAHSPLSAMSELTRHNLELWAKMQESMLAAFAAPREREPPREGQHDGQHDDKSNGEDAEAGKG